MPSSSPASVGFDKKKMIFFFFPWLGPAMCQRGTRMIAQKSPSSFLVHFTPFLCLSSIFIPSFPNSFASTQNLHYRCALQFGIRKLGFGDF